jgi:hypothetical protein
VINKICLAHVIGTKSVNIQGQEVQETYLAVLLKGVE